jgi:hypothetical protein
MTHICETANIEALIEDLVKRAGDSLRQPSDNAHRDPGAASVQSASRSAPTNTAIGHLHNTESRLENEP